MAVIESKKKLGFGMMRLPKRTDTENGELDNIDVEQVKEMVDTFIARGFTYFDTAWMYHNKNSEQVVKLALTDRYAHDRYTLADKYHLAYVKDGTPEEVFSQTQRLHSYHLDVPQAAELRDELVKLGIPMPENVITPDRCAEELYKLLQ